MSISSSGARKAGPFGGDGSAAAFPFSFKVFQASDVLVVQTDTTPVDHTLVLNTDYTVALNPNQDANPGGTVNMAVAPPAGYLLTLGSNVPALQSVTLTNNGGFYPSVINTALDYITILIQQLLERVGRALVMPFSSNASGELPPVAPGQLLGWKADGTGIDNVGASGVGAGSVVASNMAAGATGTALSADMQAAVAKSAPADADGIPLFDSAATFALKKLTWANLKATLASYLSGLTATWAISTTGNAATATLATDVTNVTRGPLRGAVSNYAASATGISNYTQTVTADEAVLENSAGQYYTARAVNLTIDANGAVGDPLSIMSARAASTWYYIWLWYNATLGLTATLDASSTAPAAPTGYASTDYNAQMPGAALTDASASTYLMQIASKGRVSQYVVLPGSNTAGLPQMASGVAGSISTPTWVAIAVGAFVPPTAKTIRLLGDAAGSGNGAGYMIAPNGDYGAQISTARPAPIVSYGATGAPAQNIPGEFMLESSNIYWASGSAAFGVYAIGWRD